ncbi:MAG TPA: TetR/AcrR family transcriptional regulator [Amycolatopsis sp.]|uniref:TetR/AcrR family transcriptional regulator n=1 Tax=Amycolatopsis sp. TaxID=37632 RepID=UPI002B475F2E|nr:TetR/AcrR family transcriptional regulator [Amycolatopsis sp.]HKS47641.1 TetR/AcrR family transcriptional regulator [Amycolatopsis sp.]
MSGRDPAVDQEAPTRDRLIATAIRLFGERGIEATSMRALTDAAGANIASVNYHFRSKEGLLRAGIDRAMRALNDERRRRLDELEAAPEPPSVADLVRVFVEPGLALASPRGQSAAVARFIGRVLSEPSPRIRETVAEQLYPVDARFLAALGRALPDRDEGGIKFVYASMVGLLGVWQSGALDQLNRAPGQRVTPGTTTADAERVIAFITAGILAGSR